MGEIRKLYELTLLGEKEVVAGMDLVNKSFDKAKKTFTDLKKQAKSPGPVIVDPAELEKERQALIDAEKALLRETTAKKEAQAEAQALMGARIQERNEAQRQVAANGAVAGSYNDLLSKIRLLKTELKNNFNLAGADDGKIRQTTAEIRALQDQINAFNRSLSSEGTNIGEYTRGIINAFKENGLDHLITGQIDKSKLKLHELDEEFNQLILKLNIVKTAGEGDLSAIEAKLVENRAASEQLRAELSKVENNFNSMGNVGNTVVQGLVKNAGSLILTYVGLHAAMFKVIELLHTDYELSDSITDLQVRLKGSKEEAEALVESLRKLNTRTGITELIDTASLVAKKGVAREEIVGITEALDKYFVVAGKGAGDREEGTASIVKLISIFNEDKHVTKERVEELTSALTKLQNSGVATGQYMVDLAERVGSVRGITGVTLPSVLGLGAGLEQLGQKSEVAGTAGIQIVTKMFSNVDKYAKLAKLSTEEFRKLLDENPLEALITLAEKLKDGKSFEAIAQDMEEVGVTGARVKAVLGDIAGNADYMRQKQQEANAAIKDTAYLSEAAAVKQNNYAASIDRIKKALELAFTSKPVLQGLTVVTGLILGLINIITAIPFEWYIGFLGLLTVAYYQNTLAIIANIQATAQKLALQIRLWAQMVIGNTLIAAGTALEWAQVLATQALTAAKWLLVTALNAVGVSTAFLEAAWTALNATFLSLPLGWIIAGVLAVAAVTKTFAANTTEATKRLDAHGKALAQNAAQLRVNMEIEKRAVDATAARIAKLQVLTQIATDLTNSDIVRKKTLEDLIKIDERYKEALDGNIIKTQKLKEITDELTKSLLEAARARAGEELLQEKQKTIIENEFKIAQLRIRQKKQEEQGVLYGDILTRDRGFFEKTAKAQIEDIQDENAKLKQDVDILAKIVARNTKKTLTGPDDKPSDTPPDGDPGATQIPDNYRDYLKNINAQREAALSELKEKRLKGLIDEEEYLKQSLDINVKYNNQILADVGAIKDQQLADLKQRFDKGEITERKYLDEVRNINASVRKLRADTAADSIDKAIETNEKLFKIEEDAAKQRLENAKAFAQDERDRVNNDPYSDNADKAAAEVKYYQDVLAAQVKFNADMDALEKNYAQKSKKNAEDRKNLLLKEQAELDKRIYELNKAQFERALGAVDDFAEYRKNQAEIAASIARVNVQKDKSLTLDQKAIEIEKINAALALEITNIELGDVNAKIKFYEKRKEQQRLTNEELKEYYRLLREKQLLEEQKGSNEQKAATINVELKLPSESETQSAIKDWIEKTFQLDDNKYGALIGNVIAESFQTAQLSMQSYFDAERANVEASKKAAYDRIDLEKEQLLAQAQSQRERESIEKQARDKKEKADHEAGEKLKKIKRSEAAIAFAAQLAYIGVAAAQNPLNGITFGAAGIAMYAILAGLATAQYLLNLSNINKQQFEDGGSIPKRGGRFQGPSHAAGGIPTSYGEFEGDELAVINKRSARSNRQYTITGTPKQIASAINEVGGGVSFAKGAIFRRFADGAYFGKTQPPIFRSYYVRTGLQDVADSASNSDRLDRIEGAISDLTGLVYREAAKKVLLDPHSVTKSQKDIAKQTDIATL